jgi:hypothetical protein
MSTSSAAGMSVTLLRASERCVYQTLSQAVKTSQWNAPCHVRGIP